MIKAKSRFGSSISLICCGRYCLDLDHKKDVRRFVFCKVDIFLCVALSAESISRLTSSNSSLVNSDERGNSLCIGLDETCRGSFGDGLEVGECDDDDNDDADAEADAGTDADADADAEADAENDVKSSETFLDTPIWEI